MHYQIKKSKDGIIKIKFREGFSSIIIPSKDEKFSVCVSCQIGCPLSCKFCNTGNFGFKRNLSSEEIIQQVRIASEIIGKTPFSVVFMGMGEPLLNLKEVLEAAEKIHEKFLISYKRITLSTSCLKNISELEQIPFNVALSFHSPYDKVRKKLMPSTIPVKEILRFSRNYLKNKSKKKYIMIEYFLIKGVNDSDEDVKQLLKLKWPKNTLFNLIEFNSCNDFLPSEAEKILKFKEEIMKAGYKCFIRNSRGKDIKAACGMLDFS